MPVNYSQTLKYLYGLERAGIKYDLKNITTLLKILKNPQYSFTSVHAAGTNGKGTVCAIINSCLIEAGCNTGQYTSPHVTDFRERIIVNGKFISKEFVVKHVSKMKRHYNKIKPSFFEAVTALAFDYFRFKKVKFAVIETGLGGRLDSTNVIKTVLSIITSISIDHTEFLGNTISKIANEKAGIIKREVPFLTGTLNKQAERVILQIARSLKAPRLNHFNGLTIGSTAQSSQIITIRMNKKVCRINSGLSGKVQAENIKIGLTAVNYLFDKYDLNFSCRVLANAFKNLKNNSKYSSRFEVINTIPKIIIDTAHNADALASLKQKLKSITYNKLYIIFALMKDKQLKECVRQIDSLNADKVILTSPAIPRAADPENLSVYLKKSKYKIANSVKDAVLFALLSAKANDAILAAGSFYLAGEVLEFLNKSKLNK